MKTQLKDKMSQLIDKCMNAGASECDVVLSKGDSFSLSAQNGEIEKYQVSGSQVMGVRVIKDNKVGLAYTESLDEDAMDIAARSAVENAKFAPENPYEKIEAKDNEFVTSKAAVDEQASTEDKIEFCLRLEEEVRKRDSRVQSVPYNGFSEASVESYLLNSKNSFVYDSEYYNSCYTSALVSEGGDSSMHYHSSIAKNLKGLDLEECVRESLEHATGWLGAKPVKTGKYDVIFTPDSFSSVFKCFTNIFSAKAAMEKLNPFKDKLGSKVMSEKLTILDLPKYKDAFSKHYADSEGIEHTDLTLVKNGVLESFYHNSVTAKFFETQTTGHGSRGAKSPLSVKGTTRVMSAGDASDSSMTNGEYLEIHSLQGLHSGSNHISGDFSFGASGYLCRDGARVQPVKGITISGNFHKMLLDINIVGDKVYATTEKNFFAPKLRFEAMSIAGA